VARGSPLDAGLDCQVQATTDLSFRLRQQRSQRREKSCLAVVGISPKGRNDKPDLTGLIATCADGDSSLCRLIVS